MAFCRLGREQTVYARGKVTTADRKRTGEAKIALAIAQPSHLNQCLCQCHGTACPTAGCIVIRS